MRWMMESSSGPKRATKPDRTAGRSPSPLRPVLKNPTTHCRSPKVPAGRRPVKLIRTVPAKQIGVRAVRVSPGPEVCVGMVSPPAREDPAGQAAAEPPPNTPAPEGPCTHAQCGLHTSTRELDLVRDIEELRSENDYLKDEVDELRAEMEEVRDSYLEEEVQQLQELRRELDRSNKDCRILQYRLRKAEQRSLQVAQAGQAEGELLRCLEQELKVAKDVSVRLHHELESVEQRRCRAEDENELLRQQLVEVEVTKQALQNDLDRMKENSMKRRGSRELHKDKKSISQEDGADLRCQLQFVKEECSLMRKKIAKLGREKDDLEQEVQKFRTAYGDVDCFPPVGEGGGPPSTREAELKLRLKLVEEEANILGRKIVELEVENRGLRGKNEDIRSHYEMYSNYGDPPESAAVMQQQLQFAEEEAEILRRSISEVEDHNRQLDSELSCFTSSSSQDELWSVSNGLIPSEGRRLLQEELKAARFHINELSGQVMKLQYDNHVLVSSTQGQHLASHPNLVATSSPVTNQDGGLRRKDGNDEVLDVLLQAHTRREGPIGGESDSEDLFEKNFSSMKSVERGGFGHTMQDMETLARVRQEAEQLKKAVDSLVADNDSLIRDGQLLVSTNIEELQRAEGQFETQGLGAINGRMKTFREDLHEFMEKVDCLRASLEPGHSASNSLHPYMSTDHSILQADDISDFQFDVKDEPELQLGRDCAAVSATQQGRHTIDPSWGADGCSKYHGTQGLCLEGMQLHNWHADEVQARLEHKGNSRPAVQQEAWGLRSHMCVREQNVLRQHCVKLHWLLQRWKRRHGSNDNEEDYKLYNMPEEESNDWAEAGQNSRTYRSAVDDYDPELFTWQNQLNENHQVLCGVRAALEELCVVLQDESQEPTRHLHTCVTHRTAGEGKWTESSCYPQKEQISWSRERAELLAYFEQQRQDWEMMKVELLQKTEELQKALAEARSKGCDPKRKRNAENRAFSPEDDRFHPTHQPAAVTHPVSRLCRSRSLWHSENLFLEALLLEPLCEHKGTMSLQPESKHKFHCLKDGLHEADGSNLSISLDEDGGSGNLLRVKSVSSMSEFHLLMASSPFLPDKDTHADNTDEVTPPLSPDDLKYIEEFNHNSWTFPSGAPEGPQDAERTDSGWSSLRTELCEGSHAVASDTLKRWPCGLNDGSIPPSDLGNSKNPSKDLKEVSFSPTNTVCPSPTVRQAKDAACQTNSLTSRSTQTMSVGLQTEALRTFTSSPHRGTPVSSPSRNMRKSSHSPAAHSKLERTPKYDSPKLQQKPSPKAEQPSGRSASVASGPKGCSESAWARSTTTRDSPVHTTVSDGLSSLFNIIGHLPLPQDASHSKFMKSPSKARPAAVAQDASLSLPANQDGSTSPAPPTTDTQGEKGEEARQRLWAPLVSTGTHSVREDKRRREMNPRREGKLGDGSKSQLPETHSIPATPWRL